MDLPVTVDSYLRFDDSLLSDEIKLMLWEALLVFNPQDPTEQIGMLRRAQDGCLLVPRGFALKLRKGLSHYGINIVWDDQRVQVPAAMPLLTPDVESLEYQVRALKRLVHAEQGIYEGPTASGKTITAAAVVSAIQQRTLVIVNKINLATQWQDRFRFALGIECGIIGDGSWFEQDVTIALRQSLWAARERLVNEGWFRRFGALMYDECHEAASAETARELVQLFPAYYRFGFSATPDRHSWMEGASRGILGEIVVRTTEQELMDAGRLVKPRVVVVRTLFKFKWNGRANAQNEYQRCLKALKVDPARNEQIRKIMTGLRGQTVLVQTDHTTHIDLLQQIAFNAGWPTDRIHRFTGEQNDERRQQIMKYCEEGDQLVISTIGKEAMDIPRLNRYMNVFPGKNRANTRQMVGRVKRTHETKIEPPIYYDFCDHRVSRLARQFSQRYSVYMEDGLDVMFVGDAPVGSPAP
jgi:superfamily II DNA or RNA helicase